MKSKDPTVVLCGYLDYLKNVRNYTFQTVRHNKSVCSRWIAFLFQRGQANVTAAEPADVVAWVEMRRGKAGASERTVLRELCILRSFYDFQVSFCGSTNPTACLPDFICRPSAEKDFLSVDECFAMLDTFDTADPSGLRDYLLTALLWCMGLRSSELVALRWEDLDLEEGTLLVRRGKGNKQRQLYFNDRLLEKMNRFRKRQLAGEKTSVFCSYATKTRKTMRGTAINQKHLLNTVGGAARAAGITRPVTPLTLRHSFATHMYEAGVPVRDIQEMMGHGDRSETSIYIHVTIDAVKRLLNNSAARTLYPDKEPTA